MKLSAKLTYEFSSGIRKRGHQYLRDGLVRIERGSDTEIEAQVRGSKSYAVRLLLVEQGNLQAWCDCPFFDSAPCKHLWAAILACDQFGYLSSALRSEELVLEPLGGDFEGYEVPYSGSRQARVAKMSGPISPPRPPRIAAPILPAWQRRIGEIEQRRNFLFLPADVWPEKRQIVYIVDLPGSVKAGSVVLFLESRDRKIDGTLKQNKTLRLKRSQIPHLPLAGDREILSALTGGSQYYSFSYSDSYEEIPTAWLVRHPLGGTIMRSVVGTGRCYLRTSRDTRDALLKWDEAGPWEFSLQMRKRNPSGWIVDGTLRRGEQRMDPSAPVLLTYGGLLFTQDSVAPLAEDIPFEWLLHLRQSGSIEAAQEHGDDLLGTLLSSPNMPPLEVPEELQYAEITPHPTPHLRIHAASHNGSARLRGELSFEYQGWLAPASALTRGQFNRQERRFVRRSREAEDAAANLLSELGVKRGAPLYQEQHQDYEIAASKLPRIVRSLAKEGWHIEAEGKIFRAPGAYRMGVASGVDWFELHGEVKYGETTAHLPELLQALRRGENMVRLSDGSYGLLPEEWLQRFGILAGLGTTETDHIRFRSSQVGLLDALLATQPEVDCDETFARVRRELCSFEGVQAAEQPSGFVGHLRDYQRDGLGWMHFLRRFSLGGCLADDMGVGKTAQVLALLETRRELRSAGEVVGPSLVVVPKSLVFNWKLEAERFTPQLRVLEYLGLERKASDFTKYDVILTTYGTLRRDAGRLQDIQFDYAVLDEAQAIKNSDSESAKAARLLRADHRLALSGTPVENHLGELWSLFEFLNPGMLGASAAFKFAEGTTRALSEDTRLVLVRALRPFLLRRTKEQVARELPPKTEQTIFCEMEPPQRKLYTELLTHYRSSLLDRVETVGLGKSKILVLEALLRLRQAACHPGLLDKKRSGDPSAKLDVLMAQLREVIEEGHKALVFSQFTSLLSIVRNRLDADGVTYEYLDGKTKDRQMRVERFQNDTDCPLFLISLKAGGLGLNLTAAEYVFLLDPWWNPAVEAQAVDRAHRIGQTRQVFTYRLIARDTVEEKVLKLQESKRDLAASIIQPDSSLMRNLKREDLELLLS